jgi:hypothetical protein
MPYTRTQNIQACRLREELAAVGLETHGSRNELVNRLCQAGVYEVDTNTRPHPPKLDRIIRYPNHSSVLLGNGAVAQYEKREQFIVQNNTRKLPLLSGDFEADTLQLPTCISIRNTTDLTPQTTGQEGDIRRKDGKLYMFRQTGVYKGWYEIQFGTILLV